MNSSTFRPEEGKCSALKPPILYIVSKVCPFREALADSPSRLAALFLRLRLVDDFETLCRNQFRGRTLFVSGKAMRSQ